MATPPPPIEAPPGTADAVLPLPLSEQQQEPDSEQPRDPHDGS